MRVDQCARQHVGRDEGEHDRFGHRAEEVAGDAAKTEHRHEDDADAQERDRRGKDDLARAVHDRRSRCPCPCSRCQLMFSIVTVASSTRMPTASARPPSVITLMVSPDRRERRHGRQDRERNRDRDDERRAPAAEKDEDHQAGQRRGDDALEDDRIDGCIDEGRLVVDRVELQALGQRLPQFGKERLDAVDDVERRSRPRLQDRHQDGVVRRRPAPC